jgi:hypothetical protein
VRFCFSTPRVDRTPTYKTSGLEWEFSDIQITMHFTGSTL